MNVRAFVLVVLGIAVFSYFAPGPLNIHGITVGMPESEVRKRLGTPATVDARTWMYYYGNLAAGAEFLEIDFGPDKRVLQVSGEQISRGRRVVVSVGDNEALVVKRFGPAKRRLCDKNNVTCHFNQVEVWFMDDQLATITMK
jgi:outer membrane protein assembly factor BamE (lipoprotein component of BamABCDE complex)